MSKYNDTILTNEGTRLATLAANGQTHYVITRAAATGDDLSTSTDEELAALTALPNEVQSGSLVEQVDDPAGSDGTVGTRVQFVNQGVTQSYSMNALGVYAREDGHEDEVLFAVTTAEDSHAQYMPDFADKVILRFGITIFVIVGDKANVTVKLDPDGLATIKFVEDAIAKIPKPDMSQYYDKTATDALLQKKVTDNGDGTVTFNGEVYALIGMDSATKDVSTVPNFVSGIKINGHLFNADPTNGVTIDGKPVYIVEPDEETAKTNSTGDVFHSHVTEES